MEELLKLLQQIQEKNNGIDAIGTKTLEKIINDLTLEIERLPDMDSNTSAHNHK